MRKNSAGPAIRVSKFTKKSRRDTQNPLQEIELTSLEKSNTFPTIGHKFVPSTLNQKRYTAAIKDDAKNIVFATGPAGTGKSFCSMSLAVEAMACGAIDKIYITRPAVEAEDEDLGFLPGELEDKFSPYLTPLLEIMRERVKPGTIDYLMKNKKIEAVPMGFMRGRTFKNCIVIVDEAQNTTVGQMKMLLTRIGENCTIIINGDTLQSDIKTMNGLDDGIRRVERLGCTTVVRFKIEDCVRSGICKQILECYETED